MVLGLGPESRLSYCFFLGDYLFSFSAFLFAFEWFFPAIDHSVVQIFFLMLFQHLTLKLISVLFVEEL